jgi:DNA invertase Pin-like site-specific DNA recombinase
MRVVGYIRVSTEQQAEEGVSLDAQRARLEAYAVAMDLDLVEVFEDRGISAKTLSRPGLTEALTALETGAADGLLVTKLDRLTRSVRDLGDLIENYFAVRFSLLSMSDSIDTRSACGRLILNVLGAVSQWELESTGERTKEGMAELTAQRLKDEAAASRLRAEGRLEEAAAAALSARSKRIGRATKSIDTLPIETVFFVQEMIKKGTRYADIASVLNSKKTPTVTGTGAWHATSIARIKNLPLLDLRPDYAGMRYCDALEESHKYTMP